MVLLKCHLGTDTRRQRHDDALSYEQLTEDVLPSMFDKDFPVQNYHITYIDPDNDVCRVTCDEELKEALLLYPESLNITMMKPRGKRKASRADTEEDLVSSPKMPRKPKCASNSLTVREMVTEALRTYPNGLTLRDIMGFMNDNFAAQVKNLKDPYRTVQSVLSSRKEFTKGASKTENNLTVWILSNQRGQKKVLKLPEKEEKRYKTRASKHEVEMRENEDYLPDEDDSDQDFKGKISEDDGVEDDEDDFRANDILANSDDEIMLLKLERASSEESRNSPKSSPKSQETTDLKLVLEAFKGLGGIASVKDIPEWVISHHPEHWSITYRLHSILTSNSHLFIEDDSLPDIKKWKLAEDGIAAKK